MAGAVDNGVAEELGELLEDGATEDLSRSQLTRLFQSARAVFNRRIHVDALTALAGSKWLKIDRMEMDSDGTNAYVKITIKVVLGQK